MTRQLLNRLSRAEQALPDTFGPKSKSVSGMASLPADNRHAPVEGPDASIGEDKK